MNALDVGLFASGELLAVAFVAASLYRGLFRQYLYLNLYVASMVAADMARTIVLRAYGVNSEEYFYAYFGWDSCVVVLKYVAIISFFEIVLKDSPFRKQARTAFLVFFALIAAMAYAFISATASNHFYKKLIVEFQQNMQFASVVLAALLCVTLAHLRVADPRLRMLVYGLGVSGATQASYWAVENLLPFGIRFYVHSFERFLVPLATVALLGLWCYAITRLPAFDAAQARDRRTVPSGAGLFAPALVKAEAQG